MKFVGRRYTRRPGAPTVVSGTHYDIMLSDNSQRSMQQMIRAVEREVNKVGLRMNADK